MSAEPSHRAADPGLSAWVSANAGAGKTHVLTNRVTRLLLAGASPSRILCLTYTKAAAAEMATRLFERLGAWALLPDEDLTKELQTIGAKDVDAGQLKTARRLFARALETPGGLKIQTIHSFCQHVLARFPVEAGIPTRFQVLDERSAQELMTSARNEVLAEARSDTELRAAVDVLAARAPDTRFADILNGAIGVNRSKLRDLLAKHGGSEQRLIARVREELGVAKGDDADQLTARFCQEVGREREQCQRVAAWLLAGSDKDADLGNCLTDFLNGDMGPHVIDCLASMFLKKDGQPKANLATAASAKAKPELAAYLTALRDRFLDYNDRRKAAVTLALTEALLTVAGAVLRAYDRKKRARAALDYDDLIRHTLHLLEDRDAAQWVLYKLDGGLDHILVDEAQDTSDEQWRIVRQLVEDFFAGSGTRGDDAVRTLFAVGDEKQSIFSFQGANPEAFVANVRNIEERAKGAGFDFKRIELEVSRRSARAVLDFVDAVFESEAAREGLTFDGTAVHHIPHRKDVVGRVEVWPAIKPPPQKEDNDWEVGKPVDAPVADAAKLLAVRVAGWIKQLLAAAPVLPATQKPAQAGDIMILVRRRNAFAEEMIRALMERQIEAAGADRMTLSEQIAIMDLVALGRFVLLPADDLNLAALLKSPLIGLSEEELFELCRGRSGTLWWSLQERRSARPSFEQAYSALTTALSAADRTPPFEFYSHFLAHGARATLIARFGAEAADAIDEFLALALMHESAHPPSLEGFLDWFGRGASEVKRDMEQGGGAVRVMTVHGAKGLQAPIVILPDTTQIPELAARAGLLFDGDRVFFGVNKNMETPPVTQAKANAHAAEMREYRRLLYVALTRAQDWLVVCGYEMKTGIKSGSWYRLVEDAAQRIGREEQAESGEKIVNIGESASSFGGGRAKAELAKAAPLPSFLRTAAPREARGQRILQPSQVTGAEAPPVFSPFDDQGYRFRRGLLVHSLLAALPDMEPAKREQAALQFLRLRDVEVAEARTLAAEALAILNHADFAPLFTPDSRGEVPISVELPELGAGTRVSGQVDRMAVTADSVLVADYKTNRPPPKNVDAVPDLYRAQMALYRAALAKIYPNKRIECALIWTDGPTFMRLPDALLDAEIAQITSRAVG